MTEDSFNQQLRIRDAADHLFHLFMTGNVVFVKKEDPAVLMFDWHQHDLDQLSGSIKTWAVMLAQTNAELTHYHAIQWLTKQKQPPHPEIKERCLEYIEMRKRQDSQ